MIDEIRRAANLLFSPGDVVELRVPNTRTRDGTISGYYNDHDKLAQDADAQNGKGEGVFWTLNPVAPALLARAQNRIEKWARHTSQDTNILYRRWWLLDFDPARPAGISSTKGEHKLALGRARLCRDRNRERGWPDPILADSGNGFHLLYRIDLPNDDAATGLIRTCIQAVAREFTDAQVIVDLQTFNAARIAKAYGTAVTKGDALPDRPHRFSRIVETPTLVGVVTKDMLEALAATVLDAEPPDGDELAAWLRRTGLKAAGPTPYKGGRRWVFEICPFNPEHRNGSAYLIDIGGKISARCHHESCTGNNWRTLQARYGKFDDDEEIAPPADLTVEPFPIDVLPKPVADYIQEATDSIGCPADFTAVPVLSALAVAIGATRQLEIKPGWREAPCIWSAVIGDPGDAKSPALAAAMDPIYEHQNLLEAQYRQERKDYENDLAVYEQDLAKWKKGGATSGGVPPKKPMVPTMRQVFTTDSTIEAVAAVLQHNPRGIEFIRDDLTGWTRAMDQYKGGRGADRQAWLSIWNGAPIMLNRKNLSEPVHIPRPFVSVCGALPPDVLPELSDERGREDGFVHRILFSFPDEVKRRWTDAEICPKTLDGYRNVCSAMLQSLLDRDLDGRPCATVVVFTAEARKRFAEWADAHLAEMHDPTFLSHLRGPWAKLLGYCSRLALILQAARYAAAEVFSEDVDEISVAGAIKLVAYFKSHSRRAYARLRSTPADRRVAEAVEWIRKRGGEASIRDIVTYRVAGCRTKSDAEELFKGLADLGWGSTRAEPPAGGGRAKTIFSLTNGVCNRQSPENSTQREETGAVAC